MITKRIIACLDVANGKVVKGVKFNNHEVIGNAVELAEKYCKNGVNELVLYDILASANNTEIDTKMIENIAKTINIPFCVAGKIDSCEKVERCLKMGADKVSINSPALKNPDLIDEIVQNFGTSTLVVGIDTKGGEIYKNTGNVDKTERCKWSVFEWVKEVENRGAGEIVVNSMSCDGTKNGFDIELLDKITKLVKVPVVASGGAGKIEDFVEVFTKTAVSGALGASVFHKNLVDIKELKKKLKEKNVLVC
ncbi:MAG: imidazole glycerol phosphate synthase subunit HisF [Rickettsiales bacterium]|nr:imidazole glycerol phosphate synthase subunit HisF [Rickettsiales bacterium]